MMVRHTWLIPQMKFCLCKRCDINQAILAHWLISGFGQWNGRLTRENLSSCIRAPLQTLFGLSPQAHLARHAPLPLIALLQSLSMCHRNEPEKLKTLKSQCCPLLQHYMNRPSIGGMEGWIPRPRHRREHCLVRCLPLALQMSVRRTWNGRFRGNWDIVM